MKSGILSSLTLLLLSGCALGSNGTKPALTPAPVVVGNFCAIYKPVYFSKNDTEETKRQIDLNNIVWVDQCEGKVGTTK